jgi:hypothetical protein
METGERSVADTVDESRPLDELRYIDKSNDNNWKIKAREWVYAKARTGEEFTAYDIREELKLNGEQARAIPSLLHSGVTSGILVKTPNRKPGKLSVDPQDWIAGKGDTHSTLLQGYKGSPRLLEKAK